MEAKNRPGDNYSKLSIEGNDGFSSTFNITSFLSAFVRNKIENKIHREDDSSLETLKHLLLLTKVASSVHENGDS